MLLADEDVVMLSVVLLAPGRAEEIRASLACLRGQTVAARLEVVIVTPSVGRLGLDPADRAGFHSVQVIEGGPFRSLGEPRALGIRRATAPLVALTEDHAFPEPGWAAALVAAHQGPWAAVGPGIVNANPNSAVSWANLLIAYGRWMEPVTSGVVDDVSGHNSSYKRAVVLEQGDHLGALLEREGALHAALCRAGHQLYLAAEARTAHQNFSRLGASLRLRYAVGRLFGAERVARGRWSPPRRWLYVAAGPLFPVLHLRRVLSEALASGMDRWVLLRVTPMLALLLAAAAVGEMMGYARGGGDAARTLTEFEFNRAAFLTPRDRMTLPAAGLARS